jgi:Tol biopolymer transport system component
LQASDLDLTRPNRWLKGIAQEIGFEVIDPLPAFLSAQNELFFDVDEHLNDRGHALVAEAVGNALAKTAGEPDCQLLSRTLSGDRYPMLSQDGLILTFQSVRNGTMELFAANRALSQVRQLTSNNVDESHPMLSPDGTHIVFTSGSADTYRTEVVLMRLADGARTVLTSAASTYGAIPSFSPTGEDVAYAQWQFESSGVPTPPRITIHHLVTGQETIVTKPGIEAWRPTFSPDGTRLAYIAKSDGQFDLYSLDRSTAHEARLTRTAFDEWDPSFTPDGHRLIYAAHAADNWDLFALRISDGETTRLTDSLGDEWDPHVSPDGQWLLYAARFGLMEGLLQKRLR